MTRAEAMKAKCRDCMCGYVDGRRDCEVPACPLYPWMPYRAQRDKPERTPKQLAADQMAAVRLRSMRYNQGKRCANDVPNDKEG